MTPERLIGYLGGGLLRAETKWVSTGSSIGVDGDLMVSDWWWLSHPPWHEVMIVSRNRKLNCPMKKTIVIVAISKKKKMKKEHLFPLFIKTALKTLQSHCDYCLPL